MSIENTLSDALAAILVDPIDHRPLSLSGTAADGAENLAAGRRYEAHDGILDLHRDAARPLAADPAERAAPDPAQTEIR